MKSGRTRLGVNETGRRRRNFNGSYEDGVEDDRGDNPWKDRGEVGYTSTERSSEGIPKSTNGLWNSQSEKDRTLLIIVTGWDEGVCIMEKGEIISDIVNVDGLNGICQYVTYYMQSQLLPVVYTTTRVL